MTWRGVRFTIESNAMHGVFVVSLLAVLLATPPVHADSPTRGAPRIREGAGLKDRPGKFVQHGERISFLPDDHQPEMLHVLENLALERVANTLGDPEAANAWRVTGVITECRGVNYLLIQRAVMRDAPPERGR